MPEKTGINADEEFITKWDRIHETRDIVKKANRKLLSKAKEIPFFNSKQKITLKMHRRDVRLPQVRRE